jgi:hypothetical protein
MKPRNLFFVLFLLVLVFGYFLKRRWSEPVAREAVERHPAHLVFTQHARCRMGCRQISETDIREILDHGIINGGKSNPRDKPCPTYALQGETTQGASIRVILAQCPAETRVITCYNLHREFSCDCPGDENKHQ